MYENVIIDETSVYEIDEQCRKCKQGDGGAGTGKRAKGSGNYADISRTMTGQPMKGNQSGT